MKLKELSAESPPHSGCSFQCLRRPLTTTLPPLQCAHSTVPPPPHLQCAVQPGSTTTYIWKATEAGTFL